MLVLSIDWDYFFPCVADFDWGHQENRLFQEFIWPIRTGSRNIFTGENALDVVQPDLQSISTFWEKVVPFPQHARSLIITESHLDLYRFLDGFTKNCTVYNFDQHHDIYYGDSLPKKPECGSWVGQGIVRGIIRHCTLVYPAWRRNNPEGNHMPLDLPTKERFGWHHQYEIPMMSDVVWDVVFVCRSSAWTPSWSDNHWMNFVGWWRKANYRLWRERLTLDFVRKNRKPNMKDALIMRDKANKMLRHFE
jgi:hypothetical protein